MVGASTVVLFPRGGIDAHHHIFDPSRFPYSPDRHLTPPQATIQQYQEFLKKLGLTSSVLVHGLSYGEDCSSLKYFLRELGGEPKSRGVAVIDLSTSSEELDNLQNHGVRGIRLNLYKHDAMLDVEKQIYMLKAYAEKLKDRRWSLAMLQINPDNWAKLVPVIRNLQVPVISDHHALLKARSMLPAGVRVQAQPGFDAIINLLKSGNFWIKLSAPYRSSERAPCYEDMKELVLALVKANPKRVLWGSDWPHTPRMKLRTREEALEETPFLNVDNHQWLRSLRSWLSDEEWDYLMIENPKKLFWW